MVRPSNPKLMARVLEAVIQLGESKGSLTRDVLSFVKKNSSGLPRNLTMQVRRALKHAVNAGLLRCKGGRYKMQLELNQVTHRHHHEDTDNHKHVDVPNEMSDELPPIGDIELSSKNQDRRKSNRKNRSTRKTRKRSGTRGTKKKVTRRRTAAMDRRVRKMSKRPRRKTINDHEIAEDWTTRKRKMMRSRTRFGEDDDDDEEEEEDYEEEEIRERRRIPKMRSVNEDRYSDVSGDSTAVGRHRSRRSKHLANERRSPSRRGNGDAEGHRKSSKRSTSRRRRSQPRQRENRQIPAPQEQTEEPQRLMDEEQDTEVMEMDEDRRDVERTETPPENQ